MEPRAFRVRMPALFGFLAALLGASSISVAQESVCGRLENHFGPFDYRSARPDDKRMVERVHFTPKVEALRGGNTSITAGGDLSYTLRVFPNHPRALLAMMKLAKKEKKEKPQDSSFTVECWLDRAERFRKDDAIVATLYGIYLSGKGRKNEALTKLDRATELGVLSPNLYYNIGLTYFDLGEFEKSLESAHKAYSGGFDLPGLRSKLKQAGKWRDPTPSNLSEQNQPPTVLSSPEQSK